MPGFQCDACGEWIDGPHLCYGKPLPKMPGRQCAVCKEWVATGWIVGGHVCSGRPLPKLEAGKKLKDYAAALYPARQDLMANDPEAQNVPLTDRKLWDFALSNFLISAPLSKAEREDLLARAVGNMTVQKFAGKSPLDRLAVINSLWNAIVEWVTPVQMATAMLDPAPGDEVHNVSSTHEARAFQRFGIGFRCEKETDLQRVLNSGFEPLYSLPNIAAALGHMVAGTVMEVKTGQGDLGLWKVNRDAIGQTGICVSRGIFGATKFPDAEYKGNVYLFAVKPSVHGYDTETYQRQNGKTKVWKPGEKLFPKIPKGDILAYVKIEKLGMDNFGTGWKIKAQNAWTFLPAASNADQQYLNAELADIQTPQNRAFLLVKAGEYDFHQHA